MLRDGGNKSGDSRVQRPAPYSGLRCPDRERRRTLAETFGSRIVETSR